MKNLLTLKSLYSLLAVAAWTLLVYVVLEAAGKMLFSVEVLPKFWVRDFFAHLVFSGLIFLMARNFKLYAIAYLLLMTLLHISNNLKMVILGGPIMPDDFISARNMFMLFNDWKLWLMVLMLTLPLAALASMIHWKKLRSWVSLSLIGLSTVCAAELAGADHRCAGQAVWRLDLEPAGQLPRTGTYHSSHPGSCAEHFAGL